MTSGRPRAAAPRPWHHLALRIPVALAAFLVACTAETAETAETAVLCGPLAGGKACAESWQCCSTQGYCGTGELYCGELACASGACQRRRRPSPPPPVARPPRPFVWKRLDADQKRRAEQLLTIFENASLKPSYGYAENLGDGRGITFGRSGFCTGTGDGVLVVRRYVKLKPTGNVLAKYLPALEAIDAAGGGDSVKGLTGFVQAVGTAAKDPVFRRVQDYFANRLYFSPSQKLAERLGFRFALSKAQLYDSYIQHGYSDKGQRVYPISANGMADWVSKRLGGSPLQGVDEKKWLRTFLARRRWVLLNTDAAWRASVQRVDIYSWILERAGWQLNKPISLTWETCRTDGARGPCVPQPERGQISIGGCIYGDFFLR